MLLAGGDPLLSFPWAPLRLLRSYSAGCFAGICAICTYQDNEISLRAGRPFWQGQTLLSIGVRALPANAKYQLVKVSI